MNTITVAARKPDPAAFGVQKYDNADTWNVPGGVAPNGVSATRYLRRTAPDVTQLTPLAAFLVAHCRRCVAGNFPAFNGAERVRCYNGKTEADTIRETAATPDGEGRYHVNGAWFRDPQKAAQLVENLIRCYALEREPARIDDWRFGIIEPDQSDEDFWNAQAARMIAAGVVRVQIGTEQFSVEG